MTLDEIVGDYISKYRDRARAGMRFFEIQRRPSEAIHKAALCQLPSGKRHPHQRRIPRAVLELAEARLQAAAKRLAAAPDFAALHDIVESEIGGILGIGALTVYDIAHRLGAHFGKVPTLVYLHAGTRTGAAVFDLRGDAIDPAKLPAPFYKLSAAETEDCLCIYKDELRGAQRGNRPSPSACRTYA